MVFYDWLYHYPFITGQFRRLSGPAKPVRHQQVCPVCGAKLVNTYFRDGEWKCRRCWEEARHG